MALANINHDGSVLSEGQEQGIVRAPRPADEFLGRGGENRSVSLKECDRVRNSRTLPLIAPCREESAVRRDRKRRGLGSSNGLVQRNTPIVVKHENPRTGMNGIRHQHTGRGSVPAHIHDPFMIRPDPAVKRNAIHHAPVRAVEFVHAGERVNQEDRSVCKQFTAGERSVDRNGAIDLAGDRAVGGHERHAEYSAV